MADENEVVIRSAEAGDAALIVRLVRELAEYERASPDAVELSEEAVLRDAFGPERRFEVLLALRGAEPVGMLIFYPIYSTWRARPGLHIEDLYLQPAVRNQGIGQRLVAALRAEAARRGCGRIDLYVLDWNPARRFYERLGFTDRDGWRSYRLTLD